ncbi:MAG: hypothetical protein ACK4TF_03400 [Thermodesulfovibrionales bacterium]
MKILYILSSRQDDTVKRFIELQKRFHEVISVDIEKVSYDDLIDLISSSDKVISW